MSFAVCILYGQRLNRVVVTPPSLETTFEFDDCLLRMFPVTGRVDRRRWQQWSLRAPTGEILDIGPGTSWSLGGSGAGGRQ